MTRAWRLDKKLPQTAIAKSAFCSSISAPRQRPLNGQLVQSISDTTRPRAAQNRCSFRARGGAHSPATQMAEGVAAAMRRRRARASHRPRPPRQRNHTQKTPAEITHKKRPPKRVTPTSPRALQPTHTANRAGPLPHEAGRPQYKQKPGTHSSSILHLESTVITAGTYFSRCLAMKEEKNPRAGNAR